MSAQDHAQRHSRLAYALVFMSLIHIALQTAYRDAHGAEIYALRTNFGLRTVKRTLLSYACSAQVGTVTACENGLRTFPREENHI